MQILEIGPWVLLAVGAFVLGRAGWRATVNKAEKPPALMWVFGFAIAGVGTYGPTFLEPYGKFLKIVFAMEENPSEETYSDFIDAVAEGNVPEEVQRLGTAVMLQHPVPELDALLERGVQRAKGEGARQQLSLAKEAVQAKKFTGQVIEDGIQRGTIDKDVLPRLDQPTRALMYERLRRLDEPELRRRALTPADVEGLRVRPRLAPIH